ncbi:DUF1259 domain-containing protein [Marininema halotolerans]|uniref:Uncharacterized protein n=1 Tax=Marininema halotolerans TaxID=1155944 RepID=A0A1I6U217_9BACL|nr:DUF1259 domain-containing protein [Marininema halotolerans]SFS95526.1 protein of unknown function [Marininema halotolerans]
MRNQQKQQNIVGRLCNRFAQIIGGSSFGVFNGFCDVGVQRKIPVRVLGRSASGANMVTGTFFNFGSFDKQGRALNLGHIAVLPEEVNPLIRMLQSRGVLISSVNDSFLSETPSILDIGVLQIEHPLIFARHIAHAFRALSIQPMPIVFKKSARCDRYAKRIGGISFGTAQGFCDMGRLLNIPVKILGRSARGANEVTSSFFNAGPVDQQGKSLNFGQIAVLPEQVNRLISILQSEGIPTSTVDTPFIFAKPLIRLVRMEVVENPLVFANQMGFAFKRLLS